MANNRLSLAKWIPAFLYGKMVKAGDLADDVSTGVADGSITPAKLDREYVESAYGQEAAGQPPSILGKVKRLWFQNDKLYGEAEDQF